MRSASFFILSLSLHVAALTYPVSFAERRDGEAIRVTLLALEPELPYGTGSRENGTPAPRSVTKSPIRTPHAVATSVESKPTSKPAAPVIAAVEFETASESNVALNLAIGALPHADAGTTSESKSRVIEGTGTGPRTSGRGAYGSGSGSRNGNAAVTGFDGGIAVTQARYRETPKPDYPESARREGREGRVVLRVLVDDAGHSRQVEINRSSGSDALDRAAAEAIKRWRFHPASHGDKPVASWLRVPIEFRLDDTTR